MKTLALFNNKGGVGKTSLVYHLGFMFAELGHKVVFADLDPQANLSSMCLSEERLEALWQLKPRPTIYGALERLKRGLSDIEHMTPEAISWQISLITGDLQLSELEDELSQLWPKCLDRDERAFRVTTALHRVIHDVGSRTGATLGLIDVGPNFGAINRAALLAADNVLVPVAPDLFSLQGLENVGPRLSTWREQWRDRLDRAPAVEDMALPPGTMHPLGYVISRHSVLAGGAVKAFQRWIDRMPAAYRTAFGEEPIEGLEIGDDPRCLGQLKDYRSLMPMAQEAKKPIFLLKPADGAIGGHLGAVREAYGDFKALAKSLLDKMDPGARAPA